MAEQPIRDRIVIADLLLRGIVGIKDEEREKPQDILVNLELVCDLRAVSESDRVDDGVNYRTVAKQVIALVESSSFYTVERMATEIARLILGGFAVAEVTVSVDKPGALRFARSVGVRITRNRGDLVS
ncbi:MAG: dihydroneopterin aldolase [Candidatus Krumholzibacteriia bacterium]